MHCTEHQSARSRLLQPLAAAALSIAGLLLSPAANAQMNQTPASPQAQSLSPSISDEKLNAAAAAIGQVTTIRQTYEPKIAAAAPSDKQHMADEANNAMKKAVTDKGLTLDEYNSIIRTAQNDPVFRQKLSQRIPNSKMTFDNRTTEAQQVAQTLGIIVGAASCSEEVTEERVNSVTAKLRRLVSAAADDTSDADAADQEFSAALEVGKTAVETGKIDPHYAEVALVELEQQLAT